MSRSGTRAQRAQARMTLAARDLRGRSAAAHHGWWTVTALALAAAPAQAVGSYSEAYQTWSATTASTWQVKDLSGAPFNVPANAVLEIAVANARQDFERTGGVRAVGSVLQRRFTLHEAEQGGEDVLVMHVQADASSRIEHYASNTNDIAFTLLGYWTSGTYVEVFLSFKAGASTSWQPHDLDTHGVGASQVAEIVLVNNIDDSEWEAGVRANGSSLQRMVDLHEAEPDGVDVATMFVQADGSANATIEVYAENDTDVDFYLVGYWSTAPGAYTELFAEVGNPVTDSAWEEKSIGSFGVPANAVAEFVLGNGRPGAQNLMGVRQKGSSLVRRLDLHEAEAGGIDLGRMQVAADGGATVEFFHEDVSDTPYYFYLAGYWVVPAVTIAETSSSTDVVEGGATDSYTVVLATLPAATVTVTVDPDGETDLGSGAGVAINLVFTTGDWSTPQTVTVTAVDDAASEGAHTSTITHTAASADSNYSGISIVNVTANVTDNDSPGVTITESNGSTDVTEGGNTDTYTVVLNSAPTATVTITVDPDNETNLGSGTGVAISLVFTTGNWSTAQTVTVTAVDDATAEGSHTSTITHSASSGDPGYDGLSIPGVTANITEFAGQWKLDDGSGPTASDCSGGSSNGSLMPSEATGPQWTRAGRRCRALTFDGANDYVNIPLAAQASSVTIVGWFKLASSFNSASGTSQILVEKTLDDKDNLSVALVGTDYSRAAVADGSLVFKIEENDAFRYKWTARTSWTGGQWYHFAVILDTSNNANNQVFIDGADNTGGSDGSGTIASIDFSADLRVGGKDPDSADLTGSRYVAGTLDEIQLFTGKLSAAAVGDLANEREYSITDLGTLTGEPSLGFGVNDAGQVSGYDESAASDAESAWLWESAAFTNLGTLGGAESAALDVNDSGSVVGGSNTAGGNQHAFVWDSVGGMSDLGTAGGRANSEARGINANDEVVGVVFNAGPPATSRLAFLDLPAPAYSLSAGMNTLGTLGGSESQALDLNDSGQVVGGANIADGNMRPFLWLPSAAYGLSAGMNDLGTLGSESRSVIHRAEAINASGKVVGQSYTAGGQTHAFYWSSGSMTDLGTLSGGDTSWALGVNSAGDVVGLSSTSTLAQRAVVWKNDILLDLNDEIPPGSNWRLDRATDVSDSGYVVGWGLNPSSNTRAFLLTPAACGCGAKSAAPTLATGSGTTDREGVLEEAAIDETGELLAEIFVTGAEPGEDFTFTITDNASAAGSDTVTELPEGMIVTRTLLVDTSAEGGAFSLTVAMLITADEMAEAGILPDEATLFVLDADPGQGSPQWTPAGTDAGESAPSTIVGQAGHVVYTDKSVTYWAVRDSVGVFAVATDLGRQPGAGANQPDEVDDAGRSGRRQPTLCGVGLIGANLLIGCTLAGARRRRSIGRTVTLPRRFRRSRFRCSSHCRQSKGLRCPRSRRTARWPPLGLRPHIVLRLRGPRRPSSRTGAAPHGASVAARYR